MEAELLHVLVVFSYISYSFMFAIISVYYSASVLVKLSFIFFFFQHFLNLSCDPLVIL